MAQKESSAAQQSMSALSRDLLYSDKMRLLGGSGVDANWATHLSSWPAYNPNHPAATGGLDRLPSSSNSMPNTNLHGQPQGQDLLIKKGQSHQTLG